ncbi:hypothetical protein NC653_014450 [Populus alba x Populus x berolinensis]|uniref:Uncharacterized protein n=1 Tax=Populus alba x Populus x berolinensis TaxID=444605 RepID=A0AAD6W4X4_9ROSI|nr:hypothetical protein NC653_014450 [Populus alba x Populus x berolinensis]
MAIPLSNFLRALFLVMGCLMVGTLVYTIYVDGFPFRRDLLTQWMIATLVDFYINVIAVALSPEESLQDPVHRVLLRHESKYKQRTMRITTFDHIGFPKSVAFEMVKRWGIFHRNWRHNKLYRFLRLSLYVIVAHALTNKLTFRGVEQKMKQSSVMSARIAFSVLGFLMLGTLIFTLLTDGSPFRKELLTPWMVATLIDFYINVVALSVWVASKESSLIGGFLWIMLVICFGR